MHIVLCSGLRIPWSSGRQLLRARPVSMPSVFISTMSGVQDDFPTTGHKVHVPQSARMDLQNMRPKRSCLMHIVLCSGLRIPTVRKIHVLEHGKVHVLEHGCDQEHTNVYSQQSRGLVASINQRDGFILNRDPSPVVAHSHSPSPSVAPHTVRHNNQNNVSNHSHSRPQPSSYPQPQSVPLCGTPHCQAQQSEQPIQSGTDLCLHGLAHSVAASTAGRKGFHRGSAWK